MTAAQDGQPPVPAHLAGRPTVGGLVVPAITPRTLDGRYLFGKLGDLTQQRCLRGYRCGVCATALPDKAVFFARPTDLFWQCTSEPAVYLFISTRPATAHRAACPAVPVWVIFTEQDRGGHGCRRWTLSTSWACGGGCWSTRR